MVISSLTAPLALPTEALPRCDDEVVSREWVAPLAVRFASVVVVPVGDHVVGVLGTGAPSEVG